MAASPTPKKFIRILGGGVTGLQTALSIRTNPATAHHHIVLIAAHLPGDVSSADYTSPQAGGHWRSHASAADPEQCAWDRRTYQHWRALLTAGDAESYDARVRTLGLGFKRGVYFWGPAYAGPETAQADMTGLWWSWDTVDEFAVLDVEGLRKGERNVDGSSPTPPPPPPPRDAVVGVAYKSICINVPRYLVYLQEQVTALNIPIIRAKVNTANGLDGVIQHLQHLAPAPADAIQEEVLINATGLAARHIVDPAEARLLHPVRGQTVLVAGEARTAVTYIGFPADAAGSELLYVIPRPGSGTTILGGSRGGEGDWAEGVDDALTERILARVRREHAADELLVDDGSGDCGFRVLSVQVGFRPGRTGGPRVERQADLVRGSTIIHSYGHSGAGYQNSVGCAEKVVDMILAL